MDRVRRIAWQSLLVLACLVFLFLLLIALNIPQQTPLKLYRLREPSLIFYGLLLLTALVAPNRRRRIHEWGMRSRSLLESKRFLPVAVIVLGFLFLDASLTRHWGFHTSSHDFSMFDETLYQTHQGRFMYAPVLGRSFLSEHFSPILLLLVPLHALVRSPYLLLVLHPLALLGAALVLRRLLLHVGTPLWLANVAFVIWPHHPMATAAVQYLVHIEILLPLLMFAALYAHLRKWSLRYWLLIVSVLAIKEDMGIYVAGLGAWVVIGERRWLKGGATALLGLAWTYLAIKVWIPFFWEGEGDFLFMSRWADWGETPVEVVLGYLTQPLEVARALLSEAPLHLFACLLFVPLLGGWGWVMVLPPWLLNATSSYRLQSNLALHHGLPLLTFATLAAVVALRGRALQRIARGRLGPILILLFVVLNVSHMSFPRIEQERPRFLAALKSIPKEASVQSMSCFFPLLGYGRDKRLIRSAADSLRAPYVLIRTHSRTWPLSREEASDILQRARDGGEYAVILTAGFSHLLKRQDRQRQEPGSGTE